MNPTLIAGAAFDARHAAEIRETARIYRYTQRIRRLAADAAPTPTPTPLGADRQTIVSSAYGPFPMRQTRSHLLE